MARAMLEGVEGFEVTEVAEPSANAAVALVRAETCAGCYRVSVTDRTVTIEGDAPSGLAYGLTEVLEAQGYRFPHPFRTIEPDHDSAWPPTIEPGERSPAIAKRGLQLHTLHPIEALEPFLVPGEENGERARTILTWMVRHRASFAQWVLLDDVQGNGPDFEERWRAHQTAIVDHATDLGVDVGVAIQLFGASNLQRAFDLVDDPELSESERDAEIRRRLQLLSGLGLSEVNVNFGEFSGEEPDFFVSELERAVRLVRDELGDVTVSATIHVGDSEEQKVVYMDQELIYYFLVQFVAEPLVPWVHTVMWYGLEDPAGGVYHHDDFREHRELIVEKMAAGEPVVYFPETAYWVAWDNSVPMYAPIYARARAADLAFLAAQPGELHGHVIFSSGWEWGYWQNDLVSLRGSYERQPQWTDHLQGIYEGRDADRLLDQLAELAALQHRELVLGELSPYLAGRDNVIEIGFMMGIVGQPDRVEPAQVSDLSADERAAYEANAAALGALATEAEALAESVRALELADDRWSREIRDGFELFALRARFVATFHAALADGTAGDGTLDALDAILEEAQSVVDRRHDELHYPDPEAILATRRRNPSLYRYGYLREADTLCFWHRERAKVAVALGQTERVPACVL